MQPKGHSFINIYIVNERFVMRGGWLHVVDLMLKSP